MALVAEASDRIVGHILFSQLALTGPAPVPAAVALAPLAVLPSHQRQGIGTALVKAGLAACAADGLTAVLVLGDPAYYGRFGFSTGTARHFATPYDGPAHAGAGPAPAGERGLAGDLCRSLCRWRNRQSLPRPAPRRTAVA